MLLSFAFRASEEWKRIVAEGLLQLPHVAGEEMVRMA